MTWTLHLGSCVDMLAGHPPRSFDVAIMDPPYLETHDRDLDGSRNDGGKIREAIAFDPLNKDLAWVVAHQLARTVRGWIVVFGDFGSLGLWRQELTAAGCAWVREGVWWKSDAAPQMTGDRPAQGIELIGLAHAPRPPKSGPMVWGGGGLHFRYQGPSKEPGIPRTHPTQKPEWLMGQIIQQFTVRGQSIVDPFTGSGTTGAVAIRAGRHFHGAELDPTFHAAATERLAAQREQPALFQETMREQISMFTKERS